MANAADLGAVRTVVVGTDGSDPAAEAVAWALEEARRRGLPLHVIAAWSASRDPQETQWLATMKSVSELRGALTDEVAVAVTIRGRARWSPRGTHQHPSCVRRPGQSTDRRVGR